MHARCVPLCTRRRSPFLDCRCSRLDESGYDEAESDGKNVELDTAEPPAMREQRSADIAAAGVCRARHGRQRSLARGAPAAAGTAACAMAGGWQTAVVASRQPAAVAARSTAADAVSPCVQ